MILFTNNENTSGYSCTFPITAIALAFNKQWNMFLLSTIIHKDYKSVYIKMPVHI